LKQENNSQKSSSHVQSVERALILIEALAEEKYGISLTELAKKVGWPKSTVHGLISTLRNYHYVEQSPTTGCYKMGVRLFELGNVVSRTWDINAVAKPHMQSLSSELGELVQLATENKGDVLYIDKVDSNHIMRIVSEVGGRLPMHCSGLGKVLLAYKSDSEVNRIISNKGMCRMTSKTIVTLPQLKKELNEIRKRGYGLDNQEVMEHLRCVAAPIFDGNNQVLYAISISGLYTGFQGEYLKKIIRLILKASQSISYDMGYRGSFYESLNK